MDFLTLFNFPAELINEFKTNLYPKLIKVDNNDIYHPHCQDNRGFDKYLLKTGHNKYGVKDPNFIDNNQYFYLNDDHYLQFSVKLYQELKNNNIRCLQEVLNNDDIIRMFIDIDSSDPIDDSTLHLIASQFKHYYYQYYQYSSNNDEHHIIRNKAFPNRVHIHFPYLIGHTQVIAHIAKQVNNNHSNCINISYLTCKLVWMPDHNNVESIYQPRANLTLDFIQDLVRFRVKAFKWEQPPLLKDDLLELFHKMNFYQPWSSDPLTDDVIKKLYSLVDEKHFISIIKSDGLLLKRVSPSLCNICNCNHEHDNMKLFLYKGVIYLYCFYANKAIKIKPIGNVTDDNEDYNVPVYSSSEVPLIQLVNNNNITYDDIPRDAIKMISSYVNIKTFNCQLETKYLKLKRITPSYCPLCKVTHDIGNMSVKLYQGSYYLFCCQKSTPLYLEKVNATETPSLKTTLKELTLYLPPTDIVIDTYEADFIKDLDINKSIQVIWSKMHTGKTTKLIEFIKAHRAEFDSILIVSPANHILSDRFKQNGIKGCSIINQKDINSLTRVYDLVVFDDITSILYYLDTKYSYDENNYRRIMELLITSAEWIVMMDTDIDDRCIKLLQEYQKDTPIHLQHNLNKSNNLIAHQVSNLDQLFTYLDNGKNIAISVSSIKTCKSLEDQLKHKAIKYLIPNNLTSSINKQWLNYQVIIYNPTMIFDFTQKHFHYHFIIADNNRASQIKRMIGRIRYLINNEIYIYNNTRLANYPIDYYTIYDDLTSVINKLYNKELNVTASGISIPSDKKKDIFSKWFNCLNIIDKQILYYLYSQAKMLTDENGHFNYQLKDEYWTWLIVQNIIDRNLSRNFFTTLVTNMLEDQGIKVVLP